MILQSHSGLVSKRSVIRILKRFLHCHGHRSTSPSRQDEQRMSVSARTDKENVVIYAVEYYLAFKKEDILPSTTTMEDPGGHFAK